MDLSLEGFGEGGKLRGVGTGFSLTKLIIF
jgi:hypothetical protein